MGEIDFNKKKARDFISERARGYHLVETNTGILTCSCGRELIRIDADTWRCTGGYPQWRISEGEVVKDKFGNMYLKPKSHEQKKGKVKKVLWRKHQNRLKRG